MAGLFLALAFGMFLNRSACFGLIEDAMRRDTGTPAIWSPTLCDSLYNLWQVLLCSPIL
jgi:hypothetical protein